MFVWYVHIHLGHILYKYGWNHSKDNKFMDLYLTVCQRVGSKYFFCGSFMFFFCLVFAMSLCASVYMCFVITCWERADLLTLVCGV